MGSDYKIYKQEQKYTFNDSLGQLEKMLEFCKKGRIKINARPDKIESIIEIKEKHQKTIEELEIQITSKQNQSIDELLFLPDTFMFCFIRTKDFNKEDRFGIQLTNNFGYKKVSLEINLPYYNLNTSKEQFITFVKAINSELNLGFRNENHIEQEIGTLVNLHFDKEFYDSSWKLNLGSNIYSSAGAAKRKFENSSTEKFRSTGFRIIFPDNNEVLRPFSKYGKSILLPVMNYFENQELDFHFFSRSINLLDRVVEIQPQKVKSEITIDLTEFIKNGNPIRPELYEGNGQVNLRIEELKLNETDEYCFTLEYYGDVINELEFMLLIDKYATDEYIDKILSLFEVKPTYSHLE